MKALIDLHCHTISSGHAYSTIKENIDEAANIGLKYLGTSDHAPSMPGTAHLFHFYNMKILPKEINGVRILKGIEANIIDFDGNIDVPEELLQSLDYVIASLHPPCINAGDINQNTNAIIKAIENKNITIIGHPDDGRYPLDYEKIVKKAAEHNVYLEINNSSLNLTSFREGAFENYKTMLNLCKKHKAKIVLGTDSHICYEIGKFPNCEKILKEVDFPDELVLNYNEDLIKELFN